MGESSSDLALTLLGIDRKWPTDTRQHFASLSKLRQCGFELPSFGKHGSNIVADLRLHMRKAGFGRDCESLPEKREGSGIIARVPVGHAEIHQPASDLLLVARFLREAKCGTNVFTRTLDETEFFGTVGELLGTSDHHSAQMHEPIAFTAPVANFPRNGEGLANHMFACSHVSHIVRHELGEACFKGRGPTTSGQP
jgi:hypothetical protein